MDPITQSFKGSKTQIMNAFPAALIALNMLLKGRSARLGLISIKHRNESMLYAHIVERSNSTTNVSIAPGLSYLKDRDNAERPDSTIRQILKELENVLAIHT